MLFFAFPLWQDERPKQFWIKWIKTHHFGQRTHVTCWTSVVKAKYVSMDYCFGGLWWPCWQEMTQLLDFMLPCLTMNPVKFCSSFSSREKCVEPMSGAFFLSRTLQPSHHCLHMSIVSICPQQRPRFILSQNHRMC